MTVESKIILKYAYIVTKNTENFENVLFKVQYLETQSRLFCILILWD